MRTKLVWLALSENVFDYAMGSEQQRGWRVQLKDMANERPRAATGDKVASRITQSLIGNTPAFDRLEALTEHLYKTRNSPLWHLINEQAEVGKVDLAGFDKRAGNDRFS